MKLHILIAALIFPASPKAAESLPAVEPMEEKLKTSEAALKASPGSDKAKIELAESLNATAWALSLRGKPGDIDAGINHTHRALGIFEALLKATTLPDAAYQLARQSMTSLNNLDRLFRMRGQPGDEKKAFDYRLRNVFIAETQYKGDVNSSNYNLLQNTYYETFSLYEKRGAAGDAATAYELGVKIFKLQETSLKATGRNRADLSRLAITAITNAGLAERAKSPDAKQWLERAYEIYATKQKSGEAFSSQDESEFAELKRKLGK